MSLLWTLVRTPQETKGGAFKKQEKLSTRRRYLERVLRHVLFSKTLAGARSQELAQIRIAKR